MPEYTGKYLGDDKELLAYWYAMKRRSQGSFLTAFLEAVGNADADNYALLRPVLIVLMEKYPAFPDDLEIERRGLKL